MVIDQKTRGHTVKVVVPRCDLEMTFFSCKGYSAIEFII